MSSDAAPRQLLIALDAFPPSLLEAWCDDGSLPEQVQQCPAELVDERMREDFCQGVHN